MSARPEGYSAGEEDYERMVARDDLDGVIIATPRRWHGPLAITVSVHGFFCLSLGTNRVEIEASIRLTAALLDMFGELARAK